MNSRLQTPLCDLLGCSYPIIQAGMGGVARSELAAAVSAAGGYGCLGMVREPPEVIAREISAVRGRTDRPFAVNLIPSATEPSLFAEELAACLEAKVHGMVYFWEVDASAIAAASDAGCRVLYQVGSVADAQAAEAAGADVIIAQGMEAGGHVRGNVSSLVLLPLVAAAVDIPVVGSGGFATGESLVAALALGAQGIHCGTAFLTAEESFAHDLHKSRVVAAGAEDTVHTDAFAINWPPGSPVRVIASDMTARLGNRLFGHHPDKIERRVVAEEEGRPIYAYSTDSPLRSMTGALDELAFFAGQAAGQVRRVEPAGTIVARMVSEAEAALTSLPGKRGTWMKFDDLGDLLLRDMPDALVVSDASGVIHVWNRPAERIFGFTEEEALGQSLDLIVPERLRERHWHGYDDTMKTGKTRYGAGDLLSVPAMRKDGERISVQFSIMPIHNDDGGLRGVAAIMRDVTEQFEELKRLKQGR